VSKIIVYPNPVLRVKTEKIKEVTADLAEDIKALEEELVKAENGAGLAATQMGKERRFFGIKDSATKKVKVFINPKILRTWGEKTYPMLVRDDKTNEDFLEGCLSFPDYYGTVKRYLKILVRWDEVEGGKLVGKEKELNGFEAIVWQHESDHLDGVLFVDHIKRDGGKFYRWKGDKKEEWSVERVIEGAL
jgi:peptide deformylase